MTCEELRDSYELYALGIADENEWSEIRVHLARHCDTCQAGVRHARELVSLLGATAPPVQPPAQLKRRVMALTGEPARRWSWWTPVWAAVAAAAVVAAVLFNVRARNSAEELAARTSELARVQAEGAARATELARVNEAFAILNAPEAKQVVFGGAAPKPPRGRVFVDPKRGVLLVASNLPPAPEGKIWEMWIIPKGGKPAPAGLFQSEADGTALFVHPGPVALTLTAAVAVTLEPAGGVPQPTSTPVIAAAL